jgi:hypothetical protein
MFTSAGSPKVGDIVTYDSFGGCTRRVRVTHWDSDIKNGRSGFDGVVLGSGLSVWGYDDQILTIESQAASR